MTKTMFVTGATGYLGSAIAARLVTLASGAEKVGRGFWTTRR